MLVFTIESIPTGQTQAYLAENYTSCWPATIKCGHLSKLLATVEGLKEKIELRRYHSPMELNWRMTTDKRLTARTNKKPAQLQLRVCARTSLHLRACPVRCGPVRRQGFF